MIRFLQGFAVNNLQLFSVFPPAQEGLMAIFQMSGNSLYFRELTVCMGEKQIDLIIGLDGNLPSDFFGIGAASNSSPGMHL